MLQLDQSERITKDTFFKSDSLNITSLVKGIIHVNRFNTTFSDSPWTVNSFLKDTYWRCLQNIHIFLSPDPSSRTLSYRSLSYISRIEEIIDINTTNTEKSLLLVTFMCSSSAAQLRVTFLLVIFSFVIASISELMSEYFDATKDSFKKNCQFGNYFLRCCHYMFFVFTNIFTF